MDDAKCVQLKKQIAAQPPPQLVPIEQFFDGNDDGGSIGCNLIDHPGMDVFRETLTGLLQRPDVDAVYAQIFEADPGEGCWPFTDLVIIAGKISVDELRRIVEPLQPDDVGPPSNFGVPENILAEHRSKLAVWWD